MLRPDLAPGTHALEAWAGLTPATVGSFHRCPTDTSYRSTRGFDHSARMTEDDGPVSPIAVRLVGPSCEAQGLRGTLNTAGRPERHGSTPRRFLARPHVSGAKAHNNAALLWYRRNREPPQLTASHPSDRLEREEGSCWRRAAECLRRRERQNHHGRQEIGLRRTAVRSVTGIRPGHSNPTGMDFS